MRELQIIEPHTYTRPEDGEVVFVPIKVLNEDGVEVRDAAIIESELNKYNAKVSERQAKTDKLKDAQPILLLKRIEKLEKEIRTLKETRT